MIFNILTLSPVGVSIYGKMFKKYFLITKNPRKSILFFLELKFHLVSMSPTTKFHSILGSPTTKFHSISGSQTTKFHSILRSPKTALESSWGLFYVDSKWKWLTNFRKCVFFYHIRTLIISLLYMKGVKKLLQGMDALGYVVCEMGFQSIGPLGRCFL